MKYLKSAAVVVLAGAAGGLTSDANASFVDLSFGAGASGTINDALFIWDDSIPGGTGVLDSFLRIQNSGIEQGYNTSGNPKPFDEKSGPWTRDVLLNELGITNEGGVDYYEFVLDINESNNRPESLLTLDELMIFTSDVASQTTTDVNSLGVLRYDMDALRDGMVLLDHAAAPGSGTSDMRFLVPVANFAGASQDDYLILYSKFGVVVGADDDSNAGFEEWSFVVPAPGAITVLLLGAMLPARRRRTA